MIQMICAYAHMHRGSKDLINVYDRYHDLILQGHPLFSQLAQWDFVANAFIIAFGCQPQTLKHCARIVKHMLEVPPAGAENPVENDKPKSSDVVKTPIRPQPGHSPGTYPTELLAPRLLQSERQSILLLLSGPGLSSPPPTSGTIRSSQPRRSQI